MSHKVEFEFGGRTMTIESGHLAKQANGAVTVQYGGSMVLSTVCASSEPKEGFDFFPLTVEYRERAYAAGKIPGGFFKREGRPSEKEIISCRIIDRPIRPMFPKDFRCETQVINFIVSHDQENDTDVLAMTGSGAALMISDVPFERAVACVRVGRIDGSLIINPTFAQLEESDIYVTLAGTSEAITMVEGGGLEVSENDMIDVLTFGHDHIKILVEKIEELKQMCGKPDMEYTPIEVNEAFNNVVKEKVYDKLVELDQVADKEQRNSGKKNLTKEVVEALAEEYPDSKKDIGTAMHDIDNEIMRNMILEKQQRIDGRNPDEIRKITCEVGFLPRAHGSAIFTRGQTQSLVAVTLGTKLDTQRLDELEGESTKSFMLHYNFPPFCTGETKPIRGTNRREIGHGALAERALVPVIPVEENFPYTVRIVSDIMESNGSSSMASVCGGSLAMMDAGVPIKAAVAGIAMGLIKSDDNIVILTDILGDEDHFGDMDFKVTGTTEGITAIQMDIKCTGLDIDTMRTALDKARIARLSILENMIATIPKHRDDISQFAPRIITIKISPDKIGMVIGPGGKMIRSIVEETGAKIDIDDDGTVHIASTDSVASQKALEKIELITQEAEVDKVYKGIVRRITTFGAFVEILPGTDGLVHISELDVGRVERVEDVIKLGETIEVKCLSIDQDGKVRLSRRALLPGGEVPNPPPDRNRRNDRGNRRPTRR